MRNSTFFFLVIATFLGVSTYLVKQSVMSVEQSLLVANQEIFRLEESLHHLKAEWSHLNEPSRLQKLVENHLNYSPTNSVKLASSDSLESLLSTEQKRKGLNGDEKPSVPHKGPPVTLASATKTP